MRLKRILSFVMCIALLLLICSCAAVNNNGKKYIAVIVKSMDSDFWHNVKNGVDSAATEYNVRVTFEGPESEEDYQTQNEMIAKAVENGADAIVFSAISFNNSAQAIDEAARKGVKIVAIDSNVNSKQVSMFIGTDNNAAGKAAGEAAVEGFSEESRIYVGIVNCDENTDNGIQREDGFRAYINSLPNAEIVDTVNVDSNIHSATDGAISLIKRHPQINVLVGFNEWMTLGVGNAIRQLGLSKQVKGIGFDTNVVSVGMIETGEMDALIVQNPFAIGYLGVKNSAELISGEPIESDVIYTAVTTVGKNNLFDEDIQKILFRFK